MNAITDSANGAIDRFVRFKENDLEEKLRLEVHEEY